MRQIRLLAGSKLGLLAAGMIIVGAIAMVFWWFLASGNQTPTSTAALEDDSATPEIGQGDLPGSPTEPSAPEATPAPEFVVVYISGAVQHPDVYRVPAAARVKDVVLAAGGLTADAAVDKINLADHVTDAQHIHIPRVGEQDAAPAPTDGAPEENQGGLLNINTASAADLDGLPGIGQAIAQRIVEYRTANGPFQTIDDLQKVKGIGPAVFAQIAPLVTVGP
jgi:competence protein ComEA